MRNYEECPDCENVVILSWMEPHGSRGNGKCSSCYGTGEGGSYLSGGDRDCETCYGTGQCQTCGGNGRVRADDDLKPSSLREESEPDSGKSKADDPRDEYCDDSEGETSQDEDDEEDDDLDDENWEDEAEPPSAVVTGFAPPKSQEAQAKVTPLTSEAIGAPTLVISLIEPKIQEPPKKRGQPSRGLLSITVVILLVTVAAIWIMKMSAPPQRYFKESVQWNTYSNERFGYTVSYPTFLVPQGESLNQDGQTFSTPDGTALLSVWGIDNAENISLREDFEVALSTPGLRVTYKRLGKSFYAVSGYLDGKILYQRVTFRHNVFWGYRLSYDEDKRQEYDALPAKITKSFTIP